MRLAATLRRRHQHQLLARHGHQACNGTHRPLVGLGAATPQAQLHAIVAAQLHWVEAQQHHPGGDGTMLRPRIELPTHTLDHRCRAEPAAAIPQSLAVLAVLGVRGNHQASAHSTFGGEPANQLFRQLAGHEHQRIAVVHRLLEHTLHLHAGGRVVRAGQAIVATTGEAVGERTLRAETGQHIGLGQRGQ